MSTGEVIWLRDPRPPLKQSDPETANLLLTEYNFLVLLPSAYKSLALYAAPQSSCLLGGMLHDS